MFERLNIFRKLIRPDSQIIKEDIHHIFKKKYTSFKSLLASNTELLNIIADIEEKLAAGQIFGMAYIRAQTTLAVFHTHRMITCLNELSGDRYVSLYDVLDKIKDMIKAELGEKKATHFTDIILPYSKVTKEMVDWVGGKNANLGEIYNYVKLPIPEGFAITTYAYDLFFKHNDLFDSIKKIKTELKPENSEALTLVSEEIQKQILLAKIPSDVENAILSAYDEMSDSIKNKQALNSPPPIAMRSSAIGEDGELSFAGQYLTALNVQADKLLNTYKYIVASLYTPRAISYRLNKGVRGEDIAMSVACLQMVEASASGVIYSRHPSNEFLNQVIISGVWGLGPNAVDGVITPDTFIVEKETLSIIDMNISDKTTQLEMNPDGGLIDVEVEADKQNKSCLLPEQIKTLAAYAVRLEDHFGFPQDIEWAVDKNAHIFILQARPLHIKSFFNSETVKISQNLSNYQVLIDNGKPVFQGAGFGKAFHIHKEDDLASFPDGAVLIARHSSPKYVVAMKKARAIIADSGSILGHMASLAREFSVPTIMDTKDAFDRIPDGMEITVDAYSGKVYAGKVTELLVNIKSKDSYMKGTPVYNTLRKTADLIVPLNLIDPKSPDFVPKKCKSLHDIMRFVHEFCYVEMFKISDSVSIKGGTAVKLDISIPIDLRIIDLEGGLVGLTGQTKKVTADNIASIPLRALIKGMSHIDFKHYEPRPVELKGFFSVISEQMLSSPVNTERFGDPSYAVISDKYLNFSSRVGYHYSVLDSYCGTKTNKNYITFSFKGGAADDVRKNRRIRAIGIILESNGFLVNTKGDRLDARYQKYEQNQIEEKLEILGRLLQFTRQMDMLMSSEASVKEIAKAFLDGNYKLK